MIDKRNTLRLPRAGVAGHNLHPFGVPVLWSINPDIDTVRATQRLNPGVFDCDSWPTLIEPRGANGRTVQLDEAAWIIFFGDPRPGTIAHEAVHAIGHALDIKGALTEQRIGCELEAYLLGGLVEAIAANVAHWREARLKDGRQSK